MRERLTSVTEPARGFDAGHWAAEEISKQFEAAGATVNHPGPSRTDPMAVEEAIALRYDNPGDAEAVLRSCRDFVALAERQELETGKHCTRVVSY
jgi:hypothetical protein